MSPTPRLPASALHSVPPRPRRPRLVAGHRRHAQAYWPGAGGDRADRGGLVMAGAASRSVLPLVDGSLDYTRAGFPSPDDAVSPGIFVPEWDDGRIAVGNGDAESHWVHDDLRVRALALREPSAKDVTVLQWNNHPETTLNWAPPADISAECAALGWTGDNCTAEGRYFTSDYAGVLSQAISDQVGGETLYFVGALGEIVGPGGANVWEVDDDHPLGVQFHPPAGARGAPRGGGRFTQLGHTPPTAYTCPATGPKTAETCTDVGFATEEDPVAGTIRAGDHLRSEVGYLRIGTVGMMFLPGEVAGELVVGLPAEFRTDPGRWYDEAAGLHAFGDEFTTGGYVLNRMHDRYEFTIGLGNDELGYIFPISNWRVACVADEFAGPGTCQALHEAGGIEHPDAVAGTTCKAITEDPSRLDDYPPDAALAVSASCRYGQALGEAQGHYEETNSAGWDLAADMMAAVAALTGDANPAEVNPDFQGYWLEFPPPA